MKVETNQLQTVNIKALADEITQPYWLAMPHSIGSYTFAKRDTLAGNPENPDKLKVRFEFEIAGKSISIERELVYKYVDPAKGEIYQPVIIAPPVTATIVNQDYIFNSLRPQPVQIKLKSFTKSSGSVNLGPVAGWNISPAKVDFSGKNKGDEWTMSFTVTPADMQPRKSVLKADVIVNGKVFFDGI